MDKKGIRPMRVDEAQAQLELGKASGQYRAAKAADCDVRHVDRQRPDTVRVA